MVPVDELIEKYGGPKPCLIGCDAHRIEDVLEASNDRRCWIRAEPTFDGLRQVVLEPGERVHVGPDRPVRPRRNWVQSVTVPGTDWFPPDRLVLNEGIVAVIGPRGSGKTALADIIAHGTDAFEAGPASFLRKAMPHIDGADVLVQWADRDGEELRRIGEEPRNAESSRYLSQHFVEQLCAEDGASTRLVEAIERVVFDALDETERGDASSFGELRDAVTEGSRQAIDELREDVAECSFEIAKLQAAKRALPAQRERLKKLDVELLKMQKPLKDLAVKGKEAKAKTLEKLRLELDGLERDVAKLKRTERRLADLVAEVVRRDREYAEMHERQKPELLELGIPSEELAVFRVGFAGDASGVLNTRHAEVRKSIDAQMSKPTGDDIKRRNVATVRAELEAVEKEIGGDTIKEKNYVELQKKERTARQERDKLVDEIKRAEEADVKTVQERRLLRYLDLFDELARQRGALEDLYAPLRNRLAAAPPERRKLSFSVRHAVDIQAWAARGEALIDFRKKGEFQERGSLATKAEELLGAAWRSGEKAALEQGMRELLRIFRDAADIVVPTATLAAFAEWLFSTEHIHVTYGLSYEATDILDLSPGTRGIVLLILYLALDESDDRPLIIDQPEENLDPQSVFEELTVYFRQARRRRQVIMVTHNPNLVVNTDSDQVIVATSQRVAAKRLPRLSYIAGGLENAQIRTRVCEILEGGERAFLQRERRYAPWKTHEPA